MNPILKPINFNSLLTMKPVKPKSNLVRFVKSNRTILIHIHGPNSPTYEVELDRANSPSQILDWILQINSKRWCSPQIIKDFLDTLEYASQVTFNHCLQASFCPFGNPLSKKWKVSKKKTL